MPATLPGTGSDYFRVEKAIRFLDANTSTQPSLAAVARHLGLSESRCHRLFHRWAGITPKDFLQAATLEHAKSLLRQSRPVLQAALESGLSGPSRLHDLFLSIESMTPGEYRRAGDGLTIRWGIHATPVGEALIALTHRGVCAIHFLPSMNYSFGSVQDPEPVEGRQSTVNLRSSFPRSRLVRDQSSTLPIAAEISHRILGSACAPLSLLCRGTPFQVKVWQALLAIPSGAVTSYGEIAARIGHPAAHRAAASAIGANPIAYLIPCHRVLRNTGAMGGYRWGEERKRTLLALESAKNHQRQ